MKARRDYDMSTRGAAVEAAHERILESAARLFLEGWYDEVTLALVARDAGVSGQTLLNHFGSKEGLFAAVIERLAADLNQRRDRAEPGDVAGAIDILVADYEITGDATIRMLALEERLAAVRDVIAVGRKGHREWVEHVFGAPGRTTELVVVTDVYAWKLLRRDRGLSASETAATMLRMADAIAAHPKANTENSRKRSPA